MGRTEEEETGELRRQSDAEGLEADLWRAGSCLVKRCWLERYLAAVALGTLPGGALNAAVLGGLKILFRPAEVWLSGAVHLGSLFAGTP